MRQYNYISSILSVCRNTYPGQYIDGNNMFIYEGVYSADSCFDACISYPGCNSIDFSDDGRCHLSTGSSRTHDLASLDTDTFIERCVDI